jgi:hypothetical protein
MRSRMKNGMEPAVGFEPTTDGLQSIIATLTATQTGFGRPAQQDLLNGVHGGRRRPVSFFEVRRVCWEVPVLTVPYDTPGSATLRVLP